MDSVCQFSGTGATLTFNGQRANYMCGRHPVGSTSVILGTRPCRTASGRRPAGPSREQVAGSPGVSRPMTMQIARVDLSTAPTCPFAGTGATISINGQRMNYTCRRHAERRADR